MFSIFGSKSTTQTTPVPASDAAPGWLSRLKAGLSRTREVLNADVTDLFSRHGTVDEALFEELETMLITADVGVRATRRLIDDLRRGAKEKNIVDGVALKAEFEAALVKLVEPLEVTLNTTVAKPFVIMIAGVNGAGKTTTIGKLAKFFQAEGKSVMLAAGDTYRAAAREQLLAWGERNNVTVVAQDGRRRRRDL